MFPPGSRVWFRTVLAECLGTVEAVHGDDVPAVRPDDVAFPVMLLLGRSLRPEHEADIPIVVSEVR